MPNTPNEWTVLSMLEWATSFFEKKKIRNPRLSIEWLLSYILDVKRLDLYLLFERPLHQSELDQLRPLVKRRAEHEPLQYIIGETDFHGVKLFVEPGVLIPRMETEQLVDIILNDHDEPNLSILDIGTGSGCIPISIKKHREHWKIVASDISNDALMIAKKNAARNEVEIEFIQDDLFNSTIHTNYYDIDILISNPPYIHYDEKDGLDQEVKNFEPELALFCESTKKMYAQLERLGLQLLKQGGRIYLELHEMHSNEVLSIFSSENWESFILKDYDQKPRFLCGKKI